MPEQKPSKGRIVLFVAPSATTETCGNDENNWTAIICGIVPPNGNVNLHAFDTYGNSLGGFANIAYDELGAAGTWRWPPRVS